MDGYVIGMATHSSSIEGQHLKQQNISLCGWKARIRVSKSEFKQTEAKNRGRDFFLFGLVEGFLCLTVELLGNWQLILKNLFRFVCLHTRGSKWKKKSGQRERKSALLKTWYLLCSDAFYHYYVFAYEKTTNWHGVRPKKQHCPAFKRLYFTSRCALSLHIFVRFCVTDMILQPTF